MLRGIQSKVTGDPGALRTKVSNAADTAASKIRNGARSAKYAAGNIKDKVSGKVDPIKGKISSSYYEKAELSRTPTDGMVGNGYDYSSYL